MTPAERLDLWWGKLRPRLLELVEEGYAIGFDADDDEFLGTHVIAFIISAETGGTPVENADPAEALEGFL